MSNRGDGQRWTAGTDEGAEIGMPEECGKRVAEGGTRSVCTRRVRLRDGVGAEGDKPSG